MEPEQRKDGFSTYAGSEGGRKIGDKVCGTPTAVRHTLRAY